MTGQRGPAAKPKRVQRGAAGSDKQSRREEYETRRLERHRQAARQAQFQRVKRLGLAVTVIALCALAVFLIVRSVAGGGTTTVAAIPGVVTYGNLARDHVSKPVSYPQQPPVGGPHSGTWVNCGIYDVPVRNENAVHSLEHGAVWITYQPTLAASAVQHLKNLAQGHAYVILSPYLNLPAPVVASAWGLQLPLQSAYDARVAQFITKYEQGPQTPEPGAPCTGSTGSTGLAG